MRAGMQAFSCSFPSRLPVALGIILRSASRPETLSTMPQPCYRFDRRHFLQIGAAGVVGATLPVVACAAGDEPGAGRAKSVLLVLLSGGPSQLDTLDPKPQAPAEVRGE